MYSAHGSSAKFDHGLASHCWGLGQYQRLMALERYGCTEAVRYYWASRSASDSIAYRAQAQEEQVVVVGRLARDSDSLMIEHGLNGNRGQAPAKHLYAELIDTLSEMNWGPDLKLESQSPRAQPIRS